jgi:uncharacterized protein YdhG (YjbR/CyaY superfamily)
MAKQIKGFSDEERVAMAERAAELRAEEKMKSNRKVGEVAVLEAIAKMEAPDQTLAKKIHALVTKSAPSLMPKTWYGIPAYANADGKVICFFQAASKFKVRYATFGFQPDALLDEGNMWPTAFAVVKLTRAEEKQMAALVKRAVG